MALPRRRTVDAVRAAADAGYRICVATGRNYTESRPTIERLSIRDECVFVGGAMVIDTATGRTLHRTAMHSEIAAEVCASSSRSAMQRWRCRIRARPGWTI